MAAGIAAIMMIGQLQYSANQADRASEERQTAMASRSIDEMFARLEHDQTTVTIWDDAVLYTQDFDLVWVDENIGRWMNEYYGVDRVYVVDGADRALYSYTGGEQGIAGGSVPAAIDPLLRTMRAKLRNGQSAAEVQVSDFVVVDGVASFVTIAPIVPYSIRVPVPEDPSAQILVEHLSTAMHHIGDAHRFSDGHYAAEAASDGYMNLPITSSTGAPMGYFSWRPYRPGETIVATSTPVLMIAIGAIAALMAYLARDIGRMSAEVQSSALEAHRQARRDHLTGLPNRLHLSEEIDRRLEARTPTAAIFVDLDNFKGVNDSLGHPAGDELIRIVAERLAKRLDGIGFVARVGGDEFTVLVDESVAETVAEDIGMCIRVPAVVDGIELPMTASIGVACCTGQTYLGSAELLRRADIALYQAKLSGRDGYKVFVPSMDGDAQRKRMIEQDLRVAMASGDQLRLAFQPLYSRSGRIDGVEALVRWTHPTLGELPPPVFIQVAEESGLILALGEWILEQACRHAARWGIGYVAVNVSAVQFRSQDFDRVVGDVLQRTGLPASRLELELTENVMADQAVAACVATLRTMGIRIALDDFGTGFSSLNYLRQFPVDKIKVDRSFVQEATTDAGSRAILVAMVRLAKALRLEITAEGVETEEQHRLLVGLGCHQFQGYLMSRPVAAEAIGSLLGGSREAAAA